MAYIAIDKDGIEYIYEKKPYREDRGFWYAHTYFYIDVPKGTSKLLTGKQMTWDDEPFELKEVE